MVGVLISFLGFGLIFRGEPFDLGECTLQEPGTPCQPALGARAGRRALRVQRVKRQPKMAPVALARETATGLSACGRCG